MNGRPTLYLNRPLSIERLAHCSAAWPIHFPDGTIQWEAEHVAEIATSLVTLWYATNVDSNDGMGNYVGQWRVAEPTDAYKHGAFNVWHEDRVVAQVDLDVGE